MAESDSGIEVTILMPCLNEAETLETCIRKAQQGIQAHGLRAEILIADNGSTDGSREIAERCGARVVPVAERGYGAALLGGIAAARGEFIVMGDADDSYDFTAIGPFVEKLREGYDLVMGCRLPKGGGTIRPGAMPWLHRWIGNPILSGIGRLFFRCPAADFHCGLRAFRKDAAEAMDLQTTGMEFASEMVIKATLAKQRIANVPITLSPDGRSRPPHLRTWRDGWRHLRFMLMYSPRWLFLVPGGLLMLLGLVFGGILVAGPMRVGHVTFDTNTLVVCSMSVLLGFTLVSFAAFAKIFAITEGLLPEDERLNRVFRYVTLEVGVTAGAVVGAAGLALMVGALLYWGRQGFGQLSCPDSLRLVVPAATLIMLGAYIVFASFFLSILGLSRRKPRSRNRA